MIRIYQVQLRKCPDDADFIHLLGGNMGCWKFFIPPYIAQFMGYVIGRIHHDLKVVFCFRHFTSCHHHYDARALTGRTSVNACWAYLVEVCASPLNYLSLSYIILYGVVCVQLAHFSSGDWKDISKTHVIIIIKSEVSALPIVIFFCSCVPGMLVTSYYVTYCIYIPGKTRILFSLLLLSLWWVQIFGYVVACWSCLFVCTLHHLIFIIVQTYLKTLNL